MKAYQIFLCVALFVCIGWQTVSAENNTTTSLIGYPIYDGVLHIQNGQCVPVNATVDISSLGWGVPYLSYYGKYVDDFDPTTGSNESVLYSIKQPSSPTLLKNYWINPSIFGTRFGYWYQNYDQKERRSSGNYRMFRVNETCPIQEPTIYGPVNTTMVNTTTPEPLSYLPEKYEATVLLARGDGASFSSPYAEETRVWVFGRADWIYDYPTDRGVVIFDKDIFKDFEVGTYSVSLVSPGKNGILEESYEPIYKEKLSTRVQQAITSPFRSTEPIIISGMQPKMIKDVLNKRIMASLDDKVTDWSISFQEPEIQIKRVDALQNPTNSTWYNIRGYTNMENGTILTVSLNGKTWTTEAIGTPSNWRQFNVLVPVDYKVVFPGYHDLKISAPNGANQIVQIYVYKELPDHFKQPEYTEYFGTSPFVTPVIVEKIVTIPVPGPTRIVTITPSEEQIYSAQIKVVNDMFWKWLFIIIGLFIAIWVIIKTIKYSITVFRRLK